MKNSLLILFLVTLFTLSCSDESVELQDQNVLDKEAKFKLTVDNLVKNQDFKNSLGLNVNGQLRSNNGNGVVVIEDETFILFGIFDGTNIYFFSQDFDDDYVAFMPNGNARFFAHSSHPLAAVINLATGEQFSNSCIEGRSGQLNTNLVASDYTVLELPQGTLYTINEYASASTLVGHSEVSDAQYWTPPGEEPYCTDATTYKTLSARFITNANGVEVVNDINFN